MSSAAVASEAVLNHIPIIPWVFGTVEKVLHIGTCDERTWNRCWYKTYEELGGSSKTSGNKGCPRAAARGLWMLGRLRRGGRSFQARDAYEVYQDQDLGKNAAYAVIAADLLAAGASASGLWSRVQSEFKRLTGDDSADSEQGEVRLVVALFRNQELRPKPLST